MAYYPLLILICTFVFFLTFTIIIKFYYKDRTYPEIYFLRHNISFYTHSELEQFLDDIPLETYSLEFKYQDTVWKTTAKNLGISLDKHKILQKAFISNREINIFTFLPRILFRQFKYELINPSFTWQNDQQGLFFDQIKLNVNKPPIEPIFQFTPEKGPDKKGRVTAFKTGTDGQMVNEVMLQSIIETNLLRALTQQHNNVISINVPIQILSPQQKDIQANRLGIVESLGKGESYFTDSISSRVYNISLAAEKLNGSLIAPGETFSFNQTIGTVSALFGYQKAYAIIKGKTVLDDGGGICQTTTALYRSVLNSGLPVTERHAHAYRVGFYEQGGFLPGLDATVYPPSPDFKFLNNTNNWILVQTIFDKAKFYFAIELFGKNDGRKVSIIGPKIVSTTPPPPPIYEDDPTLAIGQTKQIETAHPGTKTFFTRIVERHGETLINETVYSDYIPWPARFLRGTRP